MAAQNTPPTYKGYLLHRKNSLIYYGNTAQKYIITPQILSREKDQDLDMAIRVFAQLQFTDPDLKSRDRAVRRTEKDNLYAAMDMASAWLERAFTSPQPRLAPEKPKFRPLGGYYFETGGIDP